MRVLIRLVIVGSCVALSACANAVTPPEDSGAGTDTSVPMAACQTLGVDATLMSEPLGVACTLPSGAPEVASPCNREATQTRVFTPDGTSIVRFEVAPEAEGWNIELEVAADSCALVRRVPFSDTGSPEPLLSTRATIDVSVVPTSSAELDAMGGQLEARFEDGSRFLAQF